METAFATLAAVVASGFALDLWRSHLARPRPHAAAWAAGVTLYALASSALAFGLAFGWSDTSFRVFYVFGAVANIPVLALGSMYLVVGPKAGRRMLLVLIWFLGAAVWVVLAAVPVTPVAEVGVPEGSEVFDSPLTEISGGAMLPSPRIFAAVAGGVGTLLIVGLAIASTVRARAMRSVVVGNLLIVAGTVVPAVGGSLTALGEGGGFAASLLGGAVLLWAGFRVASTRRSSATMGAE
ncbi:MAG TPA: hypothetical protein VGC47_08225 [Acidimicrobiia bacterium]|jgi:hypothetical protein